MLRHGFVPDPPCAGQSPRPWWKGAAEGGGCPFCRPLQLQDARGSSGALRSRDSPERLGEDYGAGIGSRERREARKRCFLARSQEDGGVLAPGIAGGVVGRKQKAPLSALVPAIYLGE